MTINCVVVTYNRLELLRQCLSALQAQTHPIDRLIVVDNCSTDETPSYLADLASHNEAIDIITLSHNMGGAGGFNRGLRRSVELGCDFTWLMDDDTIADPTALEELVHAARTTPTEIGFLCSRVVWTDGRLSIMNTPPGITPAVVEGGRPYPVVHCSFVSVMVKTQAVLRLGLPIKEFFIWVDDIEYTERLTKGGYPGYYIPRSRVVHKTATNYVPTIDNAPVEMAPRFFYQARNTAYLKRRRLGGRRGLRFLFSLLNKYRVMVLRAMRRPKGQRRPFIAAARRGCKAGWSFYPEIEYIVQPQDSEKQRHG